MKLYGVTLTRNEAMMVPFVMPYYEKLGVDKLIVYDNESTDNTVELLKQYPFVEIRTLPYVSDSATFERNHTNVYISAYEEFYAQAYHTNEDIWLMMSDFDEVIYYYENESSFKAFLKHNAWVNGYNYYNKQYVEPLLCVSDLENKDKKCIHLDADKACFWEIWAGSKVQLFKVNDVRYFAVGPGRHYSTLEPENGKKLVSLNTLQGLFSFHLKFISREIYANRLGKDKAEKVDSDIQKRLTASFPLDDYIKYDFFRTANSEQDNYQNCKAKNSI